MFDFLANFGPQGALADRRVLDVFAGTGALMLEALSRGAREGTAIEQQPRVARHLKQQLADLGLQGRAKVVVGDARKLLRAAGRDLNGGYGLVFVDPPYATPDPRTGFIDDLTSSVLAQLTAGNWLTEDAVVIREYACYRGQAPELTCPPQLELAQTRRYGQTHVDVFVRAAGPEPVA